MLRYYTAIFTYLNVDIHGAILKYKPILFAKSMYHRNVINKTQYQFMELLDYLPPSDQAHIMAALLMDIIRDPINYVFFKEKIKNITSLDLLYKQIVFIG